MSELKEFIIGVDVAKKTLEIAVLEKATQKVIGTKSFSNTPKGYSELLLYVASKTKRCISTVVLESTGVYHENFVDYCYEVGWAVSVVLPTKIKNFTKVENIKTKNDKVDAKIIARYGCLFPLKLWTPMIGNYHELRTLSRHILALKKERARAMTRLAAYKSTKRTPKSIIESEEEHILCLGDMIEHEEAELKKLAYSDHEFKRRIQKVATIKGISELVAIQVICEVNGFEMFANTRQVTSFAGFDVVERQSGEYVGRTHISKKGNRYIRRLLYMPAMTAATHGSGKFVDLYQRIAERNTGTSKLKGLVAVERKLLIIIYTIWRKNENYDPGYGDASAKIVSGIAET